MQSLLSFKGLVSSLLFAGLVAAAPTIQELETRGPGTCYGPTNRRCWDTGFDITTDYEVSTPAGGSVSYSWEITEHRNWTGPDGVVKEYVQLINGQFPGPTLRASWGDSISVTITNKLETNGTSIHWHGLRQLHTNIQDGANGVTECPIAPTKSKTYKFTANQYGTSWYHSHFSAQYGNGVFGTIVIDGPASDNYDIDLGVFPINDYYYKAAEEIVLDTQVGPPPPSDNILFNGTNINPADPSQGKYANVTLTPNLRHRLRLINPSVENHYQVTLVGHQFTVIATDLVPVDTFTTDSIFLGVGQRYDVLIDASQAVDNYWFNVTVQNPLCGSSNNPFPAAIFHYEGASGSLPTATGTKPADANCVDQSSFVPVVTRTANQADFTPSPANNVSIVLDFTAPVTWFVNGSAINVEWDKPVLEYIFEGNTSYPRSENLVIVDEKDVWTYWVIQNLSPLPHPMHLHGHDFLVLGHSPVPATALTLFTDADIPKLNFKNPVRRDVTMLPANGWVILAFKADNPGNWLMHCHIAWHVSGGLSVDFLEQRDAQQQYITADDKAQFEQTCAEWIAYEPSAPPKIDSGLR